MQAKTKILVNKTYRRSNSTNYTKAEVYDLNNTATNNTNNTRNALSCIDQISSKRTKSIVLDRLQGKTLGTLASKYKITRERVRQIALKGLTVCEGCSEEQYRWIVETYAISCEAFCFITGLQSESYWYLKVTTPRGSKLKPFEDMLNDSNVPDEMKAKIVGYIHRGQVYDQGEYVRLDRTEIIEHILKLQGGDVTSEEFTPLYMQFLKDHNLEDNKKLAFSERFFDTFFVRADNVLCKFRHTYRYYPFDEDKLQQLLKEIHFYDLKDVEISTQYFTDRYPEVLKKYDIRDQYELHSLLRKHVPETDNLKYGRQPILMIGKCDRDKQVVDLCVANAPIKALELARVYEQTYGVNSATVLMNFFDVIKPYLFRGQYQDHPVTNVKG